MRGSNLEDQARVEEARHLRHRRHGQGQAKQQAGGAEVVLEVQEEVDVHRGLRASSGRCLSHDGGCLLVGML